MSRGFLQKKKKSCRENDKLLSMHLNTQIKCDKINNNDRICEANGVYRREDL